MLSDEFLVIFTLSKVTLAPEETSAAFSSVPVDSRDVSDTSVSESYVLAAS